MGDFFGLNFLSEFFEKSSKSIIEDFNILIYVTERLGSKLTRKSTLFLIGTGPLACLSLFPVADLDKVSNDFILLSVFDDILIA